MSKQPVSEEYKQYLQKGLPEHLGDRVYIDRKTLIGADFSGMRVEGFEARGCKFRDCRFDGARIGQMHFAVGKEQTVYQNCSFDNVRIKYTTGLRVRIEGCSFKNVKIIGWSLRLCDLVNNTFTGTMKAGKSGGSFWGAPMLYDRKNFLPPFLLIFPSRKRTNEFRGNDFSGCTIVGMDFRRGVDLRLQKLPTGYDYIYMEDGKRALEQALPKLDAWEDKELARRARGYFDIWKEKIDNGQKQLFICNNTGTLERAWPHLREAFYGEETPGDI